MGTHIVERDGRNLTGSYFDTATFGDANHMFEDSFRRVCRERVPVAFRGCLFWQDRSHRKFEQINLPLSADGDAIDKIFCAVTFNCRETNDV